MAITDTEKKWFSSLVQERLFPLQNNFEMNKNRFDHSESSYQEMIKSHVSGVIDVQVDTYIETFSHFDKRPNPDDVDYLVNSLSQLSKNGTDSFREYLTRLSAPAFASDAIDRKLQALTEELNLRIGIGLRRFNRFLMDDWALQKVSKKVDVVFWLAITGLVLTIVGYIVSILTPELRKCLRFGE